MLPNRPGVDPTREFSNPESTWRVWGDLGGPDILIRNTSPRSSFSSRLLSHHHRAALSMATHGSYLNKSDQTSCFLFVSFYCSLDSKSFGEKAAENTTGPGPHFKAAFIILHTLFLGPSSVLSREPDSPGDFPQWYHYLRNSGPGQHVYIWFVHVHMAHKVYRGVRELFFVHKSFSMASL